MKKGLLIGTVTLVSAIALSAGYLAWRSQQGKRVELAEFRNVEKLLQAGKADEAFSTLLNRPRRSGALSESEWLDLQIRVLENMQQPNIPHLAALYAQSPELFQDREKATLLLARALLEARDLKSLEPIRVSWYGRESLPAEWYAIDADALVLSGRKEQAKALLSQTQLPGKADAERLVRLAMLHADEGPETVLSFLEKARAADPENARIRSLCGNHLEAIRQFDQAAHEYASAVLLEPSNDFYRDQLGEFYRRYGKYDQALSVWSAGLKQDAPKDFTVLKTLFWSRMIQPLQLPSVPAPDGELRPLIELVQQLPPEVSWSEQLFAQIPDSRRYEQTRQEVFWLRLLSLLKAGQEQEAIKLLTYNPFQGRSFHNELERALMRVLVYRQTGTLNFPLAVHQQLKVPQAQPKHHFFAQLEPYTGFGDAHMPPDLQQMLRSSYAASAAFLAAGWREAALHLAPKEHLPAEVPEWFLYEFGLAKLANRGAEAALHYAQVQQPSPAIASLKGEALLRLEKTAEAIPLLSRVLTESTPWGARAALVLAAHFATAKEYNRAHQVIGKNSLAAESSPGRDFLKQLKDSENTLAHAQITEGAAGK